MCSDYGVVCGRITVNNGLGVPNARVSIFIPQLEKHLNDPVISALYPYTEIGDKDSNNYRYNLLPSRKQHGGHEPTGTFFDQEDILTREEILEVYETYYSYTVKTNSSGDFMIWGVPLGQQTIHVDVDLSDIGCFSLRPDDFIKQGVGLDQFKTSYAFKSSEDLNSLPQIVSFDKTIEVFPFWGNDDFCEIGLTRTDFDLSDKGVRIEPKAILLGSIFSDQGNSTLNKNCSPRADMGTKCNLITEPATIEILRFTNKKDKNNRPILELVETSEDVDDSGSFMISVPMNMEYVYTNEFGENEITNDPNKGVPTSACYRFRVSMKNESVGRVRTTASYLIPNIREHTLATEFTTSEDEIDKSYGWSTDWSDYPTLAVSDDENLGILYNVNGSYYPKDYFYRFNYNKVYSVSSFFGSYFDSGDSLSIKDLAPEKSDDCENNVVTPPVNFGQQKTGFNVLLAIIVNTFERIIYYAFLAAIQVLIVPFQALYNFRIYARALGVTIIDWRPFESFDRLVIEPLQRFGTVRLGIAVYPECETCDNLDYTNELPNTSTDPADLYSEVGTGTAIPDSFMTTYGCSSYTDGDASTVRFYINIPSTACSGTTITPIINTGYTLNDILNDYTGKYIIKFNTSGNYTTLNLYVESINGVDTYYFDDTQQISYSGGNPPSAPQGYKIYDSQSQLLGDGNSGLNSELEGGCQQYVTVYKESIVYGTYCVTNPNTPYSGLTAADIVEGTTCTDPNKFKVGQVIRGVNVNPCKTCGTHSGFSEFRYGLFTIVPAASLLNWGDNFDAITEYSRRKLVGKLFCQGFVNYSFIDNWLTGALYMFPFKAKVRWDNEQTLDLNVRRTKYCDDVLYYKAGTVDIPHKKFYYRSSSFTGTTFTMDNDTLRHPTTIVDLGPRDEFIKEICVDAQLDPNCSISRSVGPSSFQNFKEMLGLYINYKLDTLGPDGDYSSFFQNNGFNDVGIFNALNGDLLQLISINNEAGIEEFDLQNRKYAVYTPQVLDVEEFPNLLNGAFPINLQLDDGDGYRIRSCLNEPGRLTESSQKVPFFLWDKNGEGFGTGVNQSWDYSAVEVQPLQGMTYNYKYTGDTSYKYILYPMTKSYSGDVFTYSGVSYNDVFADVEDVNPTGYTTYNSQEEGFTYMYVTGGTETNPAGLLYTRTGETGNWSTPQVILPETDFVIKPTTVNYYGTKQILSTPFLFYFGLRPGKTAIDKLIEKYGPKGAFPSTE
jgi:hypothetical protein